VIGIIIVIFLMFKFGIPVLANLSSFLSGSKGKSDISFQTPTFVAPPVLDSFPEATSSANIQISGIALKNQTINLYVNDNLTDITKAGDDGKFVFKTMLKAGESTIKAKALLNNKESDFSNILVTSFKNAPPSLNVNSPTDGQSFSKEQNVADVTGTTDPDVKVTVNGFWAITDVDGNFSYDLHLQNGENKITIIATDQAGNKNQKDLTVKYSQ